MTKPGPHNARERKNAPMNEERWRSRPELNRRQNGDRNDKPTMDCCILKLVRSRYRTRFRRGSPARDAPQALRLASWAGFLFACYWFYLPCFFLLGRLRAWDMVKVWALPPMIKNFQTPVCGLEFENKSWGPGFPSGPAGPLSIPNAMRVTRIQDPGAGCSHYVVLQKRSNRKGHSP